MHTSRVLEAEPGGGHWHQVAVERGVDQCSGVCRTEHMGDDGLTHEENTWG